MRFCLALEKTSKSKESTDWLFIFLRWERSMHEFAKGRDTKPVDWVDLEIVFYAWQSKNERIYT